MYVSKNRRKERIVVKLKQSTVAPVIDEHSTRAHLIITETDRIAQTVSQQFTVICDLLRLVSFFLFPVRLFQIDLKDFRDIRVGNYKRKGHKNNFF